MSKFKFNFGDTLKCKHTGFTGVVLARSEFYNGCKQYDLQPKIGEDGKMPEAQGIDEQSLELVSKLKKEKKENQSKKEYWRCRLG
mgnify:CR=1 FL=1